MERGKLVVLEGTVGAGKTRLYLDLSDKGFFKGWCVTREPGGTEFGEKIRSVVQDPNLTQVHPYAALFGYTASRANSVNLVVRPKLEEGINVFSDRWWFSTWAYQGAEGVSKPLIWAASMVAVRGLQPDLTLFLDVPVKDGIERKMKEGGDIDRYDLKNVGFMERARKNYLQLGRLYPRSWVSIDATQSIEEVQGEAMVAINEVIRGR